MGRDSDIERHMKKMTREVGRRLKPIPSLQRDFITYSGHGKMKETRRGGGGKGGGGGGGGGDSGDSGGFLPARVNYSPRYFIVHSTTS